MLQVYKFRKLALNGVYEWELMALLDLLNFEGKS